MACGAGSEPVRGSASALRKRRNEKHTRRSPSGPLSLSNCQMFSLQNLFIHKNTCAFSVLRILAIRTSIPLASMRGWWGPLSLEQPRVQLPNFGEDAFALWRSLLGNELLRA